MPGQGAILTNENAIGREIHIVGVPDPKDEDEPLQEMPTEASDAALAEALAGIKLASLLELALFGELGEYAEAGQCATQLAVDEAVRSSEANRIPISGAAVQREPNGDLTTVCVGCNGRIPADGSVGYPTDHGETGAIRRIDDISAWDWTRVVFATTLSPCVMCTRTLMHLHGLGLRRLVIAESQSFPGRKDLLRTLPGMVIVELSSERAVDLMHTFARKYPWDWAADIGEIPPTHTATVATNLNEAWVHLDSKAPSSAALVRADGSLVACAEDQREAQNGNPVFSASMVVMGAAGSAVNIRELTLVVRAAADSLPTDIASFGSSSLGACELFRPRAVAFEVDVTPELRAVLEAAEIVVLACSRQSHETA